MLLLAFALLALLPRGARGQERDEGSDSQAEALRLEVEASRDRLWAGETVTIRLLLAVDRGVFAEAALQPFRSPLDLPIVVEGPWPRDDLGFRPLGEEAPADGPSLVVDGAIVRAERLPRRATDAPTIDRYVIARRFVAAAAGRMPLPDAHARWTRATRLGTDLFGDPVVGGRIDEHATAPAPALEIEPLPAAPPRFAGGVGRFEMDAELVAGPAADASLDVVVRVHGEGDLASLPFPTLPEGAPFHVVGRRDAIERGARLFHHELMPTRTDVAVVPPFELVVFDTRPPARYRVLRSAPLPLVSATAPATGDATVSELETPSLEGVGRAATDGSASEPMATTTFVLLLIVVPLFVLCGVVALRAHRSLRATPYARRLRRARARLASALHARAGDGHEDGGGDEGEVSRAFGGLLTALLDWPEPRLFDADLEERLARAGVSPPLARRAVAAIAPVADARFARTRTPVAASPHVPVAPSVLASDAAIPDRTSPVASRPSEVGDLARALERETMRRRDSEDRPRAAIVRERAVRAALALGLVGLVLLVRHGIDRQASEPASPADARLLAEAALAHQARNHERAVALLDEALVADAPSAPAILHDMGISALRLGRPAEAKWHFLRALRRDPDHAPSRAGLAAAEERLGLEPRDHEPVLLHRVLPYPERVLPWAAIICACAGAALLGLKRRRSSRAAALTLLVLALLAAARLLALADERERIVAVVLDRETEVRVAPHPDASVRSWLQPGAEVTLLARSDRWARLAGTTAAGWVERPRLGVID